MFLSLCGDVRSPVCRPLNGLYPFECTSYPYAGYGDVQQRAPDAPQAWLRFGGTARPWIRRSLSALGGEDQDGENQEKCDDADAGGEAARPDIDGFGTRPRTGTTLEQRSVVSGTGRGCHPFSCRPFPSVMCELVSDNRHKCTCVGKLSMSSPSTQAAIAGWDLPPVQLSSSAGHATALLCVQTPGRSSGGGSIGTPDCSAALRRIR